MRPHVERLVAEHDFYYSADDIMAMVEAVDPPDPINGLRFAYCSKATRRRIGTMPRLLTRAVGRRHRRRAPLARIQRP